MKLEVGKSYKDASEDRITIVFIKTTTDGYGYLGRYTNERESTVFLYDSDGQAENAGVADLVSEWEEETENSMEHLHSTRSPYEDKYYKYGEYQVTETFEREAHFAMGTLTLSVTSKHGNVEQFIWNGLSLEQFEDNNYDSEGLIEFCIKKLNGDLR